MTFKGHPYCSECHGAGGKMARKVGEAPRWYRCQRCLPNRPDHALSRAQSLARVDNCLAAYKHDKGKRPNLIMAVQTARRYWSLEDLLDKLAHHPIPITVLVSEVYNDEQEK